MDRETILQTLKENVHSNHLKLPDDMELHWQGSTLTMKLSSAAVGLEEKCINMQKDPAAFEGWALAFYAHLLHENGTIQLKAPVLKADNAQFDGKLGHYHRFLYRAMKFSEQFLWFQLVDELYNAVALFRDVLKSRNYVNNVGSSPAGISNKLESIVESFLAEKQPELLRNIASKAGVPIGDHPIYRQLSVRLFQAGKTTDFFSGGKSAVDLWTCDGTTLSIFELKANNKMVGMITELFFYANYVYDMFCDVNTSFHPKPPRNCKNDRGYHTLLSPEGNKICKRVQAFFLYNDECLHPLISDRVIALLNQRPEHIQYAALSYPLKITLG